MDPTRRFMMTAGLGAGVAATSVPGTMAGQHNAAVRAGRAHGLWAEIEGSTTTDQSTRLQVLVDNAAAAGQPLFLPPGRFHVANIVLRAGSVVLGVPGLTHLVYAGGEHFVSAVGANAITLDGIGFDGRHLALNTSEKNALLDLRDCGRVSIRDCTFKQSPLHGISLNGCSGRIDTTKISNIRKTGLFALDSNGLDITNNTVTDCADNGIQVWRTKVGPDATRLMANRIAHVAALSGGSGQNGNGINIFRAGDVVVSNNTISDCAYSAVRANSASNVQVLSNTCHRIGEVALYAEFEFEGAMISNNLVADAAMGISVTNFNVGGRLATVAGNLLRNLKRRELETVDKRGIGIAVEADSVVTANVVEDAESCGLALGWGAFRRDIIAAQNILRNTNIGIKISTAERGGPTLVTGNLITGAKGGAIRSIDGARPFGPDLILGADGIPGLTVTQNVTA